MRAYRKFAHEIIQKILDRVGKLETDVDNLNNYVTPQMFGAVGDGVADDTEAIKQAIASGVDVYFPSGTYLLNDSITITQKILGNNTTIITNMESGTLITLNGINACIIGFTIFGNERKCDLINIGYHTYIEKCRLRNSNKAIIYDSVSSEIKECYIDTSNYGIYCPVSDTKIGNTALSIYNTTFMGCGICIYGENNIGTTNYALIGLYCYSVVFESNTRAIKVPQLFHGCLINCWFEKNKEVSNGLTRLRIINPRIESSDAGLQFSGSDHIFTQSNTPYILSESMGDGNGNSVLYGDDKAHYILDKKRNSDKTFSTFLGSSRLEELIDTITEDDNYTITIKLKSNLVASLLDIVLIPYGLLTSNVVYKRIEYKYSGSADVYRQYHSVNEIIIKGFADKEETNQIPVHFTIHYYKKL